MSGERLQKFLAHAGVASRRAAEDIIKQGRVLVNDTVITNMGYLVSEHDVVKVDGKLIENEEDKLYIALNKPVGYVTTSKDQFGRRTVLDLVKPLDKRVYPVGRLDYDTSGLLLLTNDGDLTYWLTHPKHEIDKVYEALIKGVPSMDELTRFEKGLEIEDYVTSPARIEMMGTEKGNALVHITIHEGKNRQVRKMCNAIGHSVLTLRRVSLGPITLNALPEGKWRKLTAEEVAKLRMFK